MRVLHMIVGLGTGGAERSLYNLCVNSPNLEHSVVSLTDLGDYGRRFGDSGIPVFALGLSRFPTLTQVFSAVKIVRQFAPHIVHMWMPHAMLFGTVVAKSVGVKNLVWGIRASGYSGGLRGITTHLIVRTLAAISWVIDVQIVAVGAIAAREHIGFGFRKSRMKVIRNGYSHSGIKSSFFRRIDLPRKIGLVARFHPVKDHRTFLKALRILGGIRSDFVAVLAGQEITAENKALADQISQLGLQDLVSLLGPVEDVSKVYESLDLHVSSSSKEGFSNVVAESMLSGVPNVATDAGDSADIVGECGWVVPIKNPQALADAIDQALNLSEPAMNSMRSKASERIQREYSVHRMVADYMALYKNFATNHSRP